MEMTRLLHLAGLAGPALVLLGGADWAKDTEWCRQAGITRIVRRPVKQSDLLSALLETLGSSMPTAPQPEAAPVASAPMANGRICILVGPEYEDLEVWYPKLRLEEAGWEVVLAGIGGDREYRGKRKRASVPAR
jgi:hypothetical protein